MLTGHVEMADAARKSRRLLSVLSPDALNANWEANTIYQALKQLLALSPAHSYPITCIVLKSLPTTVSQIKNAQGETLSSVLRAGMVHVLPWNRADEKFWLAVRLGLPSNKYQSTGLKHPTHRTNDICLGGTPSAAANSTRLNDSLEYLV